MLPNLFCVFFCILHIPVVAPKITIIASGIPDTYYELAKKAKGRNSKAKCKVGTAMSCGVSNFYSITFITNQIVQFLCFVHPAKSIESVTFATCRRDVSSHYNVVAVI